MPPPPSTNRSSFSISGAISFLVSDRTATACSTLCRASVSVGFLEKTVTSAWRVARNSPRMPSRIASSPRFIPPYEPEIPICSRLVVVSTRTSDRLEQRPGQFDALLDEQRLEIVQQRSAVPHGSRCNMSVDAERREESRCLTHVPFDGMNAKCSVRDVRDAEILSSGQEVLDPHGNECPERNLERPAPEIEIAGAADTGMKVDPVAADPHRILERLGTVRSQGICDVLLEYGELGAQTPRFPDVGSGRETVRGTADDVATETQSRIADAPVRAWRFRLQPVQQARAELSGGFQIASLLGRVDSDDGAEPIIILRPVHDGDVAARESLLEIASIENATETPPRVVVFSLEQESRQRLAGLRSHRRPAQEWPWPSVRAELTPEVVLPGLVDGVVLSWKMVDCEAHRDCLLVPAICLTGRVRFSGFGLGLCSEYVLDTAQIQQVSIRRRVQEEGRFDENVSTGLEAPHDDAGDPVAMRPGGHGPIWACHEQPTADLVRQHHLVEHSDGNPGVMAKPAHPRVAWIEQRSRARVTRQR